MACYLLNRETLEERCLDSGAMPDVSLCEAEAFALGPEWVVSCFAPDPFSSCNAQSALYDRFCNGTQFNDPPDAALDRRIVPCCSQSLCGEFIIGLFRDCATGTDSLVPNVCWSKAATCRVRGGSIEESWRHGLVLDGFGRAYVQWTDPIAPCGVDVICDAKVSGRDAGGFCTTVKRINDGGECTDFGQVGCWDLCSERSGSCCQVHEDDSAPLCFVSTRQACEDLQNAPKPPIPDPYLSGQCNPGGIPIGGTCTVFSGSSPRTHYCWRCAWTWLQTDTGLVFVSEDCHRDCNLYYDAESCRKRTSCGAITIPTDINCCVCGHLQLDVGYFDCITRGGTPVSESATTETCQNILQLCNHDEFGFAFRENHEDADGTSLDLAGDLPDLTGRIMPVSEDTLRVSDTRDVPGAAFDDLGNCRHWYGWMEPSRDVVESRWAGFICNDLSRDSTGRRDLKQETVTYMRDDGRVGMLAGYLPACELN